MSLMNRISLTESGFLFDHVTGVTYTLNTTGTFIMQQLINDKSPDEILPVLLRRFEVEEREARYDLDLFVNQVRKFQLI